MIMWNNMWYQETGAKNRDDYVAKYEVMRDKCPKER